VHPDAVDLWLAFRNFAVHFAFCTVVPMMGRLQAAEWLDDATAVEAVAERKDIMGKNTSACARRNRTKRNRTT
jgi:hypothetical protein